MEQEQDNSGVFQKNSQKRTIVSWSPQTVKLW